MRADHLRIASDDGAVEIILAPSAAADLPLYAGLLARSLRTALQKTMRVHRGDGERWERIPEATFKAWRWPAGWLDRKAAAKARRI